MLVSVIIRSKDEADRLKLTLASLSRQSMPAEVVVVNDGSSDHTSAVIADAAARFPLQVINHSTSQDRPAASNAGARRAKGDVLLFLDGDTLGHPELVERHAAAHAAGEGLIGRGETFHLRCTRFLQDPEAGTPRPGEEARVAAMTGAELARSCVTRRQVLDDFGAIDRRASPGVYPGIGPRQLYEIEMDALHRHPDCPVLWEAASGSNLSVRRDAFLACGGFDESYNINEQRELGLRMCNAGHRFVPVDGARTYHLTHRVGWRDPLRMAHWEQAFYRAHPIPAVKLLVVFWAGLAEAAAMPDIPRIRSLPELAAAARGENGFDCDAAREKVGALLGLPPLAPRASGSIPRPSSI
jgi:glycosyltransferase involved in cell wall biosynthesis